MAVDREPREVNSDYDNGECEQRGEKWHHQNEAINGGICQSESSGRGHDTDEDEEGDKNPRPTQHQRLFLACPDVPEPLDEDGDGDGDDDASDLEGNLLLAFEVQEKSESAAAPNSLGRRPTVLLQNQGKTPVQPQIARTGMEEPQEVSQVRILDECQGNRVAHQGADGGGEEDTVGLMEGREMQRQQRDTEGSELEGEDEELEELAMEECLDNAEKEDGSDNSEDEDYDCDSIDEEEEDVRPAKRRRLSSRLSDEGLEHRGQQSSKHDVTQTHRSTSTVTERRHVRPKTTRTQARVPTVDEPLHTPPPSRSPSDVEESELAAVYREWPLHGFLKSTRIGNNTTFSLEFHLVGVPEHLERSAPFIGSPNTDQSSMNPRKSRSTIAHSKTRNRQPMPSRKRAPWTTQEDTTLVKMKEENCSWEEISAALSSHSQGSIQVRYSTKFSKRSSAGIRSRKRERL